MAARPNRLADEQSPYLRQHAHNPVDWYPWGPEALERARSEDRPILLSIGYSACHWCHVMERESFESEATAALMNAHFVNIKVDREERPDLDAIYMNTVQMLTGAGGWPLTVFLTPKGEPFYGGTYYPPEDRYGRPGFPRVLEAVARAYREGRGEVKEASSRLLEGLARLSQFEAKREALHPDTIARATEKLFSVRDPESGGIGNAPKFPNVPAFSLFLRRHHVTRRPEMLETFERTLTRMAQGGLYDQLGGGFHRYSVDAHWLVPHFEKMLYDNAQLVPLYLDGYVATGNPLYRRVAEETLDWVLREMTHPDGGFYSSQDADTEGEEGKTYLWRIEEMRRILGPEHAEIVCRYYQVDEVGNFAEPGHERQSILHVKLGMDDLARLFGRDVADVQRIVDEGRALLLREREKRPQPGLDDKILTSWNALAIRAFVRGANVLGEERYLEAARRATTFLLRNLRDANGRLLRTWKDGVGRYAAYLDDHAFLAAALLDLFEATGEHAYLDEARALGEILLRDFQDDAGGFFFTAHDHEDLIDRPKIAYDSSIPSGNAVATETLLRLAHLLDEERWRAPAVRTLELFGGLLEREPFGLAYMLGVLDDHLRGPTEVVVAGPTGSPATQALVRTAHSVYAPGQSVFVVDPERPGAFVPIPARGKVAPGGVPAAYVCRAFTCSPPVEDPSRLRADLSAAP